MGSLILLLLDAASVLFLVGAVLSWFPIGYDSPMRPVADFVRSLTEPVLRPVRQVLPPLGGLDLSVMVVLIGIRVLRGALAQAL